MSQLPISRRTDAFRLLIAGIAIALVALAATDAPTPRGAPPVLLGLALRKDARRAVDSVTDAIDSLADGRYDVDLPADRDDEIGRLADRVDSFADELRERERTVARRREFADDLFDAVDDVFYVLDEEGNLRRWNESLPEVTGYDDDEIAEMHALEFFAEDDLEAVADAIEEVRERGESRVEVPLRAKDGTSFDHEFVATALEDPDGNRVVTGIGRDVTERKARERELRERERQLSTLMSNVPGMVYHARNEPDWPFEFASEGCRRLTGYEPEALVNGDVNWNEDVIADRHEQLWAAVQEAVVEDEPFRVTYPIETAGGERRWIREQGRAVRAEDDSLEALEGVMIDVTEQVESHRELERTRDLLQHAQQLANVGGWELDVSEDEVWMSEEVARLHGLDPGSRVPLDQAIDFYHPEDRSTIREAVDRAVEEGEEYDVELRLVPADADRRWVRAIGEPVVDDGDVVAIRGSFQDVTDRKERERALERTRDLLQRVQRMARIGGWELDLRGDSREITWTEELYRLHDLPPDAEIDLETILGRYHPDDRPRVRRAVERSLEHETGYDVEGRLVADAGEERWVRAIGEPIREGSELLAYRGAVQDITDRKARELALESLHETAIELLNAESVASVADRIVETADEILDAAGVSLFALDAETTELDPVAYNAGFVDCSGPATSVPAGADSPLWDAFAAGTRTAVDGPSTIGGSTALGDDVDGALLVPIGDHGVFVVATAGSAIDGSSRQLVETLAATAEAAFDRLESEASLRERDAELEAQNARLRRQIRITEIIRSIDRSLVRADDREEIERTVCERLVEADGIAFAWIGAQDVPGDDFEPRAWAGEGETYLDEVSLDPDASAEPVAIAARREETTVVSSVVDRLKREPWRKEALRRGFRSVVAVPLVYEDYAYGVLSVYADDSEAFADLERTVFAELGVGIANAINAVRARTALHAETRTELSLRIDDPDAVLVRIARRAACRVEYEGLGALSGDRTVLFVSTADAEANAVASALDELVSVEDYRLIGDPDGECRFEVTIAGDALPARLVRHGAAPRSIAADARGMEVIVGIPTTVDVREFVEMLRETSELVELQGRRDVDRDAGISRALASSLLDELTPRQREVLRTAYFAGFFEWPRESTGQEIAEMLEVSQPTINRHVRLGTERLLGQLFEGEPGTKDVDR